MKFTLRQAAQQVTASKSSVLRAIQNGRLSADRDEKGSWSIDAAELFRVFEPINLEPVRTGDRTQSMGQTVPPAEGSVDRHSPGVPSVPSAALEAQIEGLKAQLELMRERVDSAEREREAWAEQARGAHRLLETTVTARRPWFGFLRRA